MNEDEFVPTPQAILNQAMKDLSRALDAAAKSQEMLLKILHRSSRFIPELQAYGVAAGKNKDEAKREADRKRTAEYERKKLERLGEEEAHQIRIEVEK